MIITQLRQLETLMPQRLSIWQKINQIRQEGYNGPLGIGLEGYFNFPNIPYIRATLHQVATAKLPIWITELDVGSGHKHKQVMFH